MSHNKEWFKNFKTLEPPREVKIVDGTTLKAPGSGMIEVLSYDGKEWKNRKLLNVLYVPKLHSNLFSGTQVSDKGFAVSTNSKRCEIKRGEDVAAVGVRDGNLYRMQFKVKTTEGAANVAVGGNTLKQWHEKLGHQNLAHVRNFLKRNNIKCEEENFTCEACLMGKQHRESFKSSREKVEKCGEVIHADVCGPMQAASIGGSRYFLLMKDGYSHFRFIYCLKEKSQVFEKMQNFIALAEKQTGHKVKVIRTDNGTEFVNAAVRKMLEKGGIRH